MIKHIASASSTMPVLESEIEASVQKVISSLTLDAQSFSRASQQYNMDFFKGESEAFRTALCRALDNFFSPQHLNGYWKANRGAD